MNYLEEALNKKRDEAFMQNKLIFIKQDKALIFEVNPTEAFIDFNNNILMTLLTGANEYDGPLKLNVQSKQNVMDFLNCNYSNINEIKRLINFFEKMSDDEYLYIYPYVEESIELYDFLKESLKPYNKGFNENKIMNYMQIYSEKKHATKKIMDEMPYKISIFEPNKKKQHLGERDKIKRKCIYCGGSISLGTATFKSEAHAIPESIGNKTYIQNEECDVCNSEFAKNIEEDLCTYLIPDRLMFGIRGKEGLPIFQFNNEYVRHIDTESEDFNKEWGKFETTKQLLELQRPFKGGIILGNGSINKTDSFNIEYVKNYILQNVYKAMVKCVMGVIDKGLLPKFEETLNWIKDTANFKKLPPIIICECAKICLEPELYIFVQKYDNSNLPFCYGELRLAKKIFIFIMPFNKKDKCNFIKKQQFQEFENYICKMYHLFNNEYQLVDFSDVDKKTINIPLQFIRNIKISDINSTIE